MLRALFSKVAHEHKAARISIDFTDSASTGFHCQREIQIIRIIGKITNGPFTFVVNTGKKLRRALCNKFW